MPLSVPPFVTIIQVAGPREQSGSEPEFVVPNGATGRHFAADAATVRLLEAVQRGKGVPDWAMPLVERLRREGVLVRPGETEAAAAPRRAPVDGRLVSAQVVLVDAAGLARALDPLGRVLFRRPDGAA